MKHYKDRDYFYVIDDEEHLHMCEAKRGTSWTEIPESSALEAVVLLGPNAFPTKGGKKHLLGKTFGYLVVNPLRAFRLACENRSDFIFGSIVVSLFVVFISFLTWGACSDLGRRNPPDKTGTPTSIVVEYGDGTRVAFPVKNVKPIVEEKK